MRFEQSLQRLPSYLKSGRPAPQSRRPRRRLECENLETRLAPACSAFLNGAGTLTLTCGPAADTVTLNASSTHVLLAATGMLPASFPLASVSQIRLDTGSGNDTVNVERSTVGKPVFVNTEGDNDTVHISPVAKKLSNLPGLVILTSGFGNDKLDVNDQLNAGSPTYTLSNSGLSRTGIQGINFTGFTGGTVINGGSGSTTCIVTNTSVFPITLNTGTGANTVHVQRTSGPLTVNGQNGLDTVNVGGASPVDVGGTLVVTNSNGSTALTIDSSAAIAPKSATLSKIGLSGLSPGAIAWVENDLRSLVIKGGSGGNTFTVNDTPAGVYNVAPSLHSGTGADTVHVRRTTGALTVHGQGGFDTVAVGLNGSVQSLTGALQLTNALGYTGLTIDNAANAAPKYVTLDAVSLTGLAPAPISWAAGRLSSLDINGGSGGNSFFLNDTPSSAVRGFLTTLNSGVGIDQVYAWRTTGPVTVNGQDGVDYMIVGTADFEGSGTAQQILGPVTVKNTSGRTRLEICDSANPAPRSATLNRTSLTGLAPAAITWVENDLTDLRIAGGDGGNTFSIQDTPLIPNFGKTVIANGTGANTENVYATTGHLGIGGTWSPTLIGTHTVTVGSMGNTLDTIQGRVDLYFAYSPGNRINLHDQGSVAGHDYTIGGYLLLRTGAAEINLSGLDYVTVNAGSGDDAFYTTGFRNNWTLVALDGGGGVNSVYGPDADVAWRITGSDAGMIESHPLTFAGMANLIGGAGTDVFAFGGAGSLSGSIDGGGSSHNTLDYTQAVGNGVYVNLLLGVAHDGVSALTFLTHIQDVQAGDGQDILVGDDASNILDGGVGHDLIIGGGSGYTLNPDTLIGGHGEDILIAGFTVYDTDAQALSNIRAEWTSSGHDYATRVAHLQNGTGLGPVLNATTVFSNYAGNTVTGGAERDLFFANLTGAPDATDWDAPTEEFLEVF